MADGSERREARRFTMTLPIRVLAREANEKELSAQTRDVSYRGLFFHSEANLPVGTPIEFVITLPRQVSKSGDVNIRCSGQIVRVESVSNGRMGFAARIERYEFVPLTATAA